MKKLLKKISVVILALTLSLSVFTGCNKPREADQKLEVFIANRGYGIDGVTAALNAFKEQQWVKDKYPNLEIKPTDDRTPNLGINKLRVPKNNQYDLIFVIEDLTQFFGSNSKGESTLVELTEIYKSTVPNENVTVKEKMLDVAIDYAGWKDPSSGEYKYYDMSWCTGYTGMVYNPRLFANYLGEGVIPRTTQEIIDLLIKIKTGDTIEEKPANMTQAQWNKLNCGNEGGFGIAPCGSATYDSALFEVLWAQYDGYESFNDFWNGLYYDPVSRKKIQSYKMFEQEGRLYALEFIREFIDYDSEYYDLSMAEYEFIPGQTTFLKGEYAMTNCSDWFDSEMRYVREQMQEEFDAGVAGAIEPEKLEILKAPIVSQIVDKLGKYNNNQKMTDEQLSFVIKCIDEKKDYETAKADFATQFSQAGDLRSADYDRLLEARAIAKAPGISHTVCIPSVSNSIDVAKDFLKFMATDVCQLAYMAGSQGQTLPFKFNVESTDILYGTSKTVADAYQEVYNTDVSLMQKTRLDIIFNPFNAVKTLNRSERKPLSNTNFKAVLISGDISRNFREKDAASAQSVFDATKAAMDQGTLNRYLYEAGLRDSY